MIECPCCHKLFDETKRYHISLAHVGAELKTNGVGYFAFFRNKQMDLEFLKRDIRNVDIFASVLANYAKKKQVPGFVLAPQGSRAAKNGFHFLTEVAERAALIYPFVISKPFVNRENKIYFSPDANFSKKFFILDDIVTRGRTIKKM